MMSGNPQAEGIFTKDVADTYRHLVERVAVSKAEATAAEGKEQIQLVAEDPNTTISFIVPDGPPPEDLRLEGPGTEELDVEEVRKALQHRWDIFEQFPEDFKSALKTESLDAVNKVLGDKEVEEAENLVELLQVAGILNVASGVRDETGKGA
jgi:cell division cycle protein 37